MEKQKICFSITSITDNGVTRVVSILLNEIDYQKYDVTLLLTRKRPRRRSVNPNVKIIEVSKDLSKGIFGKISNIYEIHRILKKEKFDKIIALGDYAAIYTLIASYCMKCYKIISERNDPNREPDKKIFRILRDIVYRTADLIVCQTRDAAKYYKEIVKERVIIPNPISNELPLYTSGERDKRVVNFCRIDKQKNLPLLIDAFKEFIKIHKDYILEIYGDGPSKEEIYQYINSSGMVDYIKMYDFSLDIHEKIKKASMFVSSSDFEGMSNSMLEAMAIGVPTICTDCPIGGAKEVIETGVNGWLIPVNDKKSLVNVMNYVADNPDVAECVANNGTKIRKTLAKEKICSEWWKIIK